KVGILPAALQQFEQRSGQKGVIIKIGVVATAAVPVNRKQPSFAPLAVTDEIERPFGSFEAVGTVQSLCGDCEPANGERVPAGENLLVAPRLFARLADLEQSLTRLDEFRRDNIRCELRVP